MSRRPILSFAVPLILGTTIANAQNLLYVASLNTDGATVLATYNATDRSLVTQTGVRSGALTLSPDGRILFATDANGNSVGAYAAGSNVLQAGLVTGTAPIAAAVSANGNSLVVGNMQSGTVSVINARTFAPQGTLAIGFSPAAVAIHPDSTEAFVANQNGGDIAALALTGAVRITRRIPVAASPVALEWLNADTLLVLDAASERVIRVNRASGQGEGSFEVGAEPVAMALSRGRLYVSNGADTTIRMFNAATGATAGTITLPTCPAPRCAVMSLAVSPDGNTLYAANSNGREVFAVNLADNTLTQPFTVTAGPRWLAVGPRPTN